MKLKLKYAKVERMLREDFEEAKERHDFYEMADDYEMLLELWLTGELDSEEYHKHMLLPMVHCFGEVKDNKIELPSVYKSCKQNFGKKVIYSLESDGIKIVLDDVDDERIFDYFNEEGIETKVIELSSHIELDSLARNTLELHNSDVVEIMIDEELIAITKV